METLKKIVDSISKAQEELAEAESKVDLISYCDADDKIRALIDLLRMELDDALEEQMQLAVTLDTC